MEKQKPNLVYVIFSLLGAILVALIGVLKGNDLILENGSQLATGQGMMYFIVAGLVLIGAFLGVVAEFVAKKDLKLSSALSNVIGLVVFLILEAELTVASAFAAVAYFALTVFQVIGIYAEKKGVRTVALILSSITLFMLVVTGCVGLYETAFHFYYVGLLFGYIFVGLSLFLSSLFTLIRK